MSFPVKGLFFDLDGTLLDTAPEFTACLNLVLAEEGKSPLTVEALRSYVSEGAKGMVEFGFQITEENPTFLRLKQRFLDLYAKTLGQQTRPFPGILTLIAKLIDLQMPWGIVTNKPSRFAFPLLEHFALFKNTPVVIAGDTLCVQKPSPLPLLKACEHFDVSPQACWYVGDAKTDVIASKAAGFRAAIVKYGYIPPDTDPLDWQADKYFESSEEMQSLLSLPNMIQITF